MGHVSTARKQGRGNIQRRRVLDASATITRNRYAGDEENAAGLLKKKGDGIAGDVDAECVAVGIEVGVDVPDDDALLVNDTSDIDLLAFISSSLILSATACIDGLACTFVFQHSVIRAHTPSVIHRAASSDEDASGRFGISGDFDILVMTWISRLISANGCCSVKHSSMVIAKE